ncbi:50S ribosomal protein L11 methyltransferase [Synechococcus elongatus]|uniref:Ribosomal protein L11 methyltransferase n=2 Tax=Synechococcus elongatus TaxID=32046 RepID=PRMA_SYNE7|nr:50S ribosomal protein L11 methyltransferase [Synechococcus elongatus]Q31N39.1 RecName: Full=Ribosomal protein L11 methyltransferase; Short=L11 Mtase [Synechococcus elongatus PCC 7942 = FACHB-805]Q5MZ45.1 RecName: Full=Ribosomal protein L11 methyltransferase; Short=L11 Mtase [Synechococcus elongatus PCC 6301]MBD2689503.1 50S ribosomal protein L11 methyltransferase [Synechococcus elongatus FACHB-1061]ABB57530.1 LSU ribosomal protein L11P methyltransferase [Synechococcus elongatus PCC 7942 = FA
MPVSQSWWQVEVHCDPLLEDLLYWRLSEAGGRGFVCESKAQGLQVHSYFPAELWEETIRDRLLQEINADAADLGLPTPSLSWQTLDEEDWSESWKRHWQPQELGDRFLIQPAWLEPEPSDRLLLQLDPGTAFGTGAHPTTQLCLEGLETVPVADKVIADVGCGSGILAIGALLLGAKQVYAVDTDPLAVGATQANAALNDLEGDRFWTAIGSADQLQPLHAQGVRFDGFLCNILAHIIQALTPTLSELASPGSWAIFSGLLTSQADTVSVTLEEYGWVIRDRASQGDWCRLVADFRPER